MDAKAIDEKSKALQKAQASNESPQVIVGIINDLKKGVSATEEILRSTRIGVIVSKFKNSKNPEIARTASDTVRKWREEVEKKRQQGGGANGKKVAPGTPNSGTGSLAPAGSKGKAGGATEAATGVPPDQRTWKADKADIHRTGDMVRDNCIGLIYNGLVFLTTTPSNSVLSIALQVEEAAFKQANGETSTAYREKMRMLFQNLKNKANPGLRVRVLSGEIKPERLVTMTHDELKSKERQAEDEKIAADNLATAQTPIQEVAISGTLTCGKCGQKTVSYTQAQTRSADEPMTTFCTCMTCGKRWRM